jgi:hypothetical protein
MVVLTSWMMVKALVQGSFWFTEKAFSFQPSAVSPAADVWQMSSVTRAGLIRSLGQRRRVMRTEALSWMGEPAVKGEPRRLRTKQVTIGRVPVLHGCLHWNFRSSPSFLHI